MKSAHIIDIYVISRPITPVIPYVQGVNAIPLIFRLHDYAIEEGASASVFVKKKSGKEVYNTAEIMENEVHVDVTTQMVAEYGQQYGQIQIIKGEKTLRSFLFILDVEKSVVSNDAIESLDEYDVLTKAVEAAEASKDAAKASEKGAAASASAASVSEKNAKASENAASKSATAAAGSADAASKSASAAAGSATAADASKTAAEKAKTAAETAAKRAETVSEVHIATEAAAGIVKANADEIKVAEDGTMSISTAYTEQETLTEVASGDNKKTFFGKIVKAIKEVIAHTANKGNPHSVTKAQVGLGNVDNTKDINKSVNHAKTADSATAAASATTAASATKATQDGAGNEIVKTYIKALAAAGRALRGTKGDGTTFDIANVITPLINNRTTNQSGTGALDAAQGKALQDEIDTLNSNIVPKITFTDTDGLTISSNEAVAAGKIAVIRLVIKFNAEVGQWYQKAIGTITPKPKIMIMQQTVDDNGKTVMLQIGAETGTITLMGLAQSHAANAIARFYFPFI